MLVSFTAIYGIWAFVRTAEDPGVPLEQPFQDQVEDPKRVIPKTIEEFRDLLSKVDTVEARVCGVTHFLKDLPPLKVNLDRGMGGFVPVAGKPRDQLLELLEKRSSGRRVARRKDFDPGIRLVLKLRDERTVHCLVHFARTLRVLADKDIDLNHQVQLGNMLANYCAESSQPAASALGYVVQSADGMYGPKGPPYYPVDMERIRCGYVSDSFLHYRIGLFPKLHTVDVSDSALTLTPAAFDLSQWTDKTRTVYGNLRSFAARGAPLQDDDAAAVLGLMKSVETLDLADCTQLADNTVQAIAKLPRLRELDLSGCTGIPTEMFAVLAASQELLTVRLSREGLTAGQQKALKKSLGARLRWTSK